MLKSCISSLCSWRETLNAIILSGLSSLPSWWSSSNKDWRNAGRTAKESAVLAWQTYAGCLVHTKEGEYNDMKLFFAFDAERYTTGLSCSQLQSFQSLFQKSHKQQFENESNPSYSIKSHKLLQRTDCKRNLINNIQYN